MIVFIFPKQWYTVRVLVGFLKAHRGSPPGVPTAAGGGLPRDVRGHFSL